MIDEVFPYIITIVIVIAIVAIINALLNHRIKKIIIQSNPVSDTMQKLLSTFSGFEKEALKWAVILVSGGLGLVVLEFIPYNFETSPLPYGVIALFLGAGFLFYYLLVRKKNT